MEIVVFYYSLGSEMVFDELALYRVFGKIVCDTPVQRVLEDGCTIVVSDDWIEPLRVTDMRLCSFYWFSIHHCKFTLMVFG